MKKAEPSLRARKLRRINALALALMIALMIVVPVESVMLILGVARLRGISESEGGELRREIADAEGVYLSGLYAVESADASPSPLKNEACLMDSQGTILLKTENWPLSGPALAGDGLRALLADGASAEQLLEDLRAGRAGEALVTVDGEPYYLTYAALGSQELRYAALLPAQANGAKADTLSAITRRTALVLSALAALVLVTLLRNRTQLDAARYVDSVTGGNSRARFFLEAERICAYRRDKAVYAVVYTNIRHYSVLCEHLSHAAGNRILAMMSGAIRAHIDAGEAAGRLQDDNFAMLVRFDGMEALEKRLRAIHADTAARMEREGLQTELATAYGVFVMDSLLDDYALADAVGKAGMACAQSREEGVVSVNAYDAAAREQLLEEKRMEDLMRTALEKRQFEVLIQPKVRLSDRSVAGGELLVRWRDPERGLLSPGAFLPLFEKNGFITKLDLFIMEEACRVLESISEAGLAAMPLSINLPKRRMASPEMLEEYGALIDAYRVSPALIEFEFNESMVYANIESLTTLIDKIHGMGCKCSMDHFGNGYSSLSLLRKIHVDALKLDANFFSDTGDERALLVASGIISLAGRLNMATVAEGVETREQVEFLAQVGCDMVQGYILAKPMPAEQFLRMVKHGVRFE